MYVVHTPQGVGGWLEIHLQIRSVALVFEIARYLIWNVTNECTNNGQDCVQLVVTRSRQGAVTDISQCQGSEVICDSLPRMNFLLFENTALDPLKVFNSTYVWCGGSEKSVIMRDKLYVVVCIPNKFARLAMVL